MMKKIILSVTAIIAIAAISGYYLDFTDLATELVVNESTAVLIPGRFKGRVEAMRKPLNNSTRAIVKEMHHSGIDIDQLTAVIDNTTEEQAYRLLDELNRTKPKTTNEVFDILQKHLVTNFDSEIFRDAFNEHLTIKQIRRTTFYINQNRKTHDVEFATAKEIMKMILIEEDKNFRQPQP